MNEGSPYRIQALRIDSTHEYDVTIKWKEWRDAETMRARMVSTLWAIAALRPDDSTSAIRLARALLQDMGVELPP